MFQGTLHWVCYNLPCFILFSYVAIEGPLREPLQELVREPGGGDRTLLPLRLLPPRRGPHQDHRRRRDQYGDARRARPARAAHRVPAART